jgi:hypothetical protein
VVFCICELENIGYLVLQYLNSGAAPFEERAEEWSHHGEIKSSSILATGFGGGLV